MRKSCFSDEPKQLNYSSTSTTIEYKITAAMVVIKKYFTFFDNEKQNKVLAPEFIELLIGLFFLAKHA